MLFEKDGVYIQVNVNSNTTDKDAHIPGKVYLMKKVYNQTSKSIHTPLWDCYFWGQNMAQNFDFKLYSAYICNRIGEIMIIDQTGIQTSPPPPWISSRVLY